MGICPYRTTLFVINSSWRSVLLEQALWFVVYCSLRISCLARDLYRSASRFCLSRSQALLRKEGWIPREIIARVAVMRLTSFLLFSCMFYESLSGVVVAILQLCTPAETTLTLMEGDATLTELFDSIGSQGRALRLIFLFHSRLTCVLLFLSSTLVFVPMFAAHRQHSLLLWTQALLFPTWVFISRLTQTVFEGFIQRRYALSMAACSAVALVSAILRKRRCERKLQATPASVPIPPTQPSPVATSPSATATGSLHSRTPATA
ncbi:hypothetical protein PAPYR_1276 [Paratrimastix pyriformis]|uniref:Uncharacterized protein n=1 Tax=Paratrimastix pyriformis TaxID=342808 RepID=A0ABQ8USJ5_9EUKA|nr:hypothetical protein PAPYR_1276 [Paratrimastix pyriformis]